MKRRLLLAAAALPLLAGPASQEPASRVLDDFRDVSAWTAAPSEGVRLELSRQAAEKGSALRLDFDFQGRAGWAAARRDISIELAENWELAFEVRGAAPPNTLEIKLIDPTRENVWWSVRREFTPESRWRPLRLKKRHFSFAWGPAGGGEIRRAAAFEIAITAGSGGRGWIEISDLTLTSLPLPQPPPQPIAIASSSLAGFSPERAIDGDASTSWRSRGSGEEWIALDLGERREYGGLTVQWEPGRFARAYDVQTSDDGAAWKTERSVQRGNGGRDDLYLPDSESRWVRLRLSRAAASEGYAIREIVIRPLSWSETPNAFFQSIARESPRGTFPRSFSGEQSYWTVVGVEGDSEKALFSEDGGVEPARGSFSVEPFLFEGGRLDSWSSVEIEHALEAGTLPIPRVTWRRRGLALEVTAFAFGPPRGSTLQVRYRLLNAGRSARRARLFLAVRPFQVNPPTQFLNQPGGVAPIGRLGWDGKAVVVDGLRRIFPEVSPAGFGAVAFDEGPLTDLLAEGKLPASRSTADDIRHASGALAFDFAVPGGKSDEISIRIPFHAAAGGTPEKALSDFQTRGAARALVAGRLAACTRAWRERLGRVVIDAPSTARPVLASLRTSLAEILVERDGAALSPGTRAYARSWIRDGAMMSAALLRLGYPEVVRAYIDWFAPYQRPDGRIPCCVDRRGADPVVENDSHGEFLFLVAEYWRFTRDQEFVRSLFPSVEKTVGFLDGLRRSRRTPEFESGGKLAFFGLLPESISHEGYSEKPVHSYWDDFWALAGLKGAVTLARAAGREDLSARWTAIRDEFAADLHASLRRTMKSRGIDFLPGSAELADFDPTSTTIALDPAGELSSLPKQAVFRTFERYYSEFLDRRDGRTSWDAYTPYETRTVGSFVRLGWRGRAQELLDFFLAGRRPAAWNQWAEVVGREARVPRFIGDMPHAWVGSDFIRSVLDLFAFERETDGALVLAAGLPAEWLRGRGASVARLRTPYGPLDYRLAAKGNETRFSVSGELTIPPGGIALAPPLSGGPYRVTVDGRPVEFSGEELVLRRLPAEVLFQGAPERFSSSRPLPTSRKGSRRSSG